MNFPPFLRCTRTGNGGWRCTEMQAPGRAYCQRHYIEQKRRNERKRLRKLAAAAAAAASSTNRRKVHECASGWSSVKRRIEASEDSATDETDSEDDEETESESEYILKQGITGGDRSAVNNYESEEDHESEENVIEEDEVVGVPNWRWRAFRERRVEVNGSNEQLIRNGSLFAGNLKRSVVGKRSSMSRKRRDMSRGMAGSGLSETLGR